MSKTFTVQETLSAVAAKIKETITDYEAFAKSLRKKELTAEHGKELAKSLCLICAEPEFGCSCLNKAEKAEMSAKYANKAGVGFKGQGEATFKPFQAKGNGSTGEWRNQSTALNHIANNVTDSSIVPKTVKKDDGMGEASGGDTMAMAEMCKSCGKSGDLCKCMGKTELNKTAMPSAKPPEGGGIGGKQPVGQGGGDAHKVGTPTASNTPALASAKGVPNTSVAQANKEMGSFQSIASNPTAMPGNVRQIAIPKAPRINAKMAAPASQRFHGALPLQRTEVK